MVIVGFVFSIVSVIDDASASTAGNSNTYKTPGIMMKFCQNPAMAWNECDERYEGYTWTDRVNVLIYAPGWNEDSDKIDYIGNGGNGGEITVTTREASSKMVAFAETGTDTGLFMGVVKLTGQMSKVVHDSNGIQVKPMGMNMDNYSDGADCTPMQIMMNMCVMGITNSAHDWAVKLKTNQQDGGVTVSWEANEDITVVQSATWNWRLGEISFDKEVFTTDELVTFTLHDADLWNHHAIFYKYFVNVWSDSDSAGIQVPVMFEPNHSHVATLESDAVDIQLSEPASSSLTKYTPDGAYKAYLWWQPGGVIGVDKDYSINLMVHDGLTDVHQTKLSYGMEIWLNGELLETRSDRFASDGHAVESVYFEERGTAKIILTNIFDTDSKITYSFQVAPEAIIKEVVGKHAAFKDSNLPDSWKDRQHGHYIDVLNGQFSITMDDSSKSTNALRVNEGDTIYVEYIDMTLPAPYAHNKEIEIKANTFVFVK